MKLTKRLFGFVLIPVFVVSCDETSVTGVNSAKSCEPNCTAADAQKTQASNENDPDSNLAAGETLTTLEAINFTKLRDNSNLVVSEGSYKVDDSGNNPLALCYNTSGRRRKIDFSSTSIPYAEAANDCASTEPSAIVNNVFDKYFAQYMGWGVNYLQYLKNVANIRSAGNVTFQYEDTSVTPAIKVTRWIFNSNNLPDFVKNSSTPGAGYAIQIGKSYSSSVKTPFFTQASTALRFSAKLNIPTYVIAKTNGNTLPLITNGFPSITAGFAIGIFSKTKAPMYSEGNPRYKAIEFMAGLLPGNNEHISTDTRNFFVGSAINDASIWISAKGTARTMTPIQQGNTKTLTTNGYKTFIFDINRENLRKALIAANAKIAAITSNEQEQFDTTNITGGVDPLDFALFKGITIRSENRFMYAGSAAFELKLDYIKVDRVSP